MRLSFLPKSLAPFAGSIKPGAPSAPPAGESAPAPPRSRALARFAGLSAILAASATVLVSLGSHSIETRAVAPKVGAPVLKPADDGGHVRWHTAAIDVVVDKSFSDLAGDDLLSTALGAWRVSGAVLPSVSTLPGEERKVGYDPDGPNENVVVYAPNGWTKANGALAVTVLTYETTSGRIVDADLLVNGGGRLFERFDHDESDPNSDPVSIEHSSSGSGTEATSGKTARFDLQSVVTHELGHFFGLGEDYDDGSTTMYYRTRAGEIHKRLITKGDSDVIGALYAEGASDTTPSGDVGCGRSQLARGRGSPPSWMGLAVAALGLALLGIARRARTEQLRVRALAPRRRIGSRRWARFGGWLSGFGFIALLAPVKLDAAPDVQRVRGDADVEVVAVVPRWADGIIETELTLRVASCRIAQCPQADQHTVVAGGTLGGVTQVVGPFAVPAVGARLGADMRALGALQIFNPTMKR